MTSNLAPEGVPRVKSGLKKKLFCVAVVSTLRVLASLDRSLLLYGRLKFVGCLADPSQLEDC